MAKILVCISNAIYDDGYKIACFYDQFLNSLADSGNEVKVFIPNMFNEDVFCSDNQLRPNVNENKLRQDIKDFAPQLVITFNHATYHKILECTDCPIVIWDADLLPLWNQVDLIKKNLDRYIFFCFSEFGRHYINEQLGVPFNQTYLMENATSLKRKEQEQDVNISFIGTYFGTHRTISDYITHHSGEPGLLSVMDAIKKNPFIPKKDLEHIIGCKIDEIDEKLYTGFFSSENRINALNSISDLGLELYGDTGWLSLADILPSLSACYIRKKVYTALHNQDLYNRSKVCININHSQSVHGMPWRVFDIMATGGCLVSSFSSAIQKKLRKCVDIPMFENHYEARKLCKKLLKDSVWRNEIVSASNEYIDKYARWPMRFKQMEEIFGIKLCNNLKGGSLTILEPKFCNCFHVGNWSIGIRRKKKDSSKKDVRKGRSCNKRKMKKIKIKIWPRTYLELNKNHEETAKKVEVFR